MLLDGCWTMNTSRNGTNELLEWREAYKISFKCIRCTQPELNTFLVFQYTSAMAAIVNLLNITGDAAGRLFEGWMPPSMVPMNFLGGEELRKIFLKCIRHTQLSYTPFCCSSIQSAMAAIVNQQNNNGDAAGHLFKKWTQPSVVQCTSMVVSNSQKLVASVFIVHSLSNTPFWFSSILVLWQI